ncbi:SURF1 family cytochrome oxidase biogenesis protein [Corynebacterium sp. S7]
MSRTSVTSWWKKFLSPGWVITAVLIVIFSYFAFSFLAPWQLGKDDAIVERNDRIEAAYTVDPVPVTDVVAPDGTYNRDQEWTRVTLTGHYLADSEVLLRLRPVESHPAFQSLVPFELNNGQVILINRGWVDAVDGTKVAPIAAPPSNEVTVTGVLRVDEGVHTSQPLVDQGYQQVYSINTDQIANLTGQPLAQPWIMVTDEQPGSLNPLVLPQLERGNHLSYGLQWIAFGVMAPLGLLIFIRSEFKERRRVREEEAELALAGPDPHPENEPDTVETSRDDEPAQAQRMRNRYGDSRRSHWAKNSEREQERI